MTCGLRPEFLIEADWKGWKACSPEVGAGSVGGNETPPEGVGIRGAQLQLLGQ